jgi:hypothetical protein
VAAEATGAEPAPVRSEVALAIAWLARDRDDVAAVHLDRALASAPDDPEAHQWTAYLRIRHGAPSDAVEHLRLAAAAAEAGSHLHDELAVLLDLAGCPPEVDLPVNPEGRLRFRSRYRRRHHRSGWQYAVGALEPLHNPDGVLFESFLEDPFAWQHPRPGVRTGPELLAAFRSRAHEDRVTSEERGIVPFREPWIGFVHNPPNMPPWFHGDDAPQTLLAKDIWRESASHCLGLFALSEYLGDWLRTATGKPVSTVLHPTETPQVVFDFDRFVANPRKFVVQVGWWLRRQCAIDRLPLVDDNNPLGIRKLRLVPGFGPTASVHVDQLRRLEARLEGPLDPSTGPVLERDHLPDDEYDVLLAENICFVDLYDASANNAVIECLVRATPILVNPLPAVREYLGNDYPLYYDDLHQAAAMALDLGRLRAAHEHLAASPLRNHLDAATFRRAVENSEIYRRL